MSRLTPGAGGIVHAWSLNEGIVEYFPEEQDFIINVGGEDIPAHTGALMCSSNYFGAMLKLNTLERKAGRVVMKDVDIIAVEKCVDFIYTGDISFSFAECESLIYVADMMQLEEVCDVVATFLKEGLSLDTFVCAKKIAYLHNCDALDEACDLFAQNNFEKLAIRADFRQFVDEYVEFLIMNLKHLEAVKARYVLLWANSDVKNRTTKCHDILHKLDITKIPVSYRKYLMENEPLVRNFCPIIKLFALSLLTHNTQEKRAKASDRPNPRKRKMTNSNIGACSTGAYNTRLHATAHKAKKVANNENSVSGFAAPTDFKSFFMLRHESWTRRDKQKCDEFALKNFRELALHESFGGIEEEYLLHLLKSSKSVHSDKEKLGFLIRWVNFDLQNRHQVLEKVLRHLDISKLCETFLCELVKNEPITSECRECLKIIAGFKLDKIKTAAEKLTASDGVNAIALFNTGFEKERIEVRDIKTWAVKRIYRDIKGLPCSTFCTVLMGRYLYVFPRDWFVMRMDYHAENPHWERLGKDWVPWAKNRSNNLTGVAATLGGFIFVYWETPGYDEVTNDIYRYQPDGGSWSLLPSRRVIAESSCFTAADGCLYCMGGRVWSNRGWTKTLLNEVERYDPKTDLWTRMHPMLEPRGAAVAIALDRKIIVAGGYNHSDDLELRSTECYDIATDTWSCFAPTVKTRHDPVPLTIAGEIYLLGGDMVRRPPGYYRAHYLFNDVSDSSESDSEEELGWDDHHTIEMYNSKTESWEHVRTLNSKVDFDLESTVAVGI